MCGIAGKIIRNKKAEVCDIENYAPFLKERGPENIGYFEKKNVSLLHTRLSIVDLSSSANQPMVYNDIAITFNGEIYNYKELKKELGYLNFKTNSDTEVLIIGYKVWGIKKLLQKIDGMFAFVIVDFEKSKVFICRDIFGKKPLYYYVSESEFIFSSDIRPIQKEKKNILTIDYDSLDYFLTELSVPQPKTIWKEIKQVTPSCYIEFDINSFNYSENKFWRFDYYSKININEDEAIKEVEKKLVKSILKRTIADVPYALFLSGGVDSGLITTLLSLNIDSKVNTFTLGFDFDDFNEFDLAKIVADKYNTNHTEVRLKTDIKKILPNLIEYLGEPFADSSIIPTYLITKEFSKQYKLALSGDGGDEVFGGYYEYNLAYMSDMYFFKNNNLANKSFVYSSKLLSRINKKIQNKGKYYEYFRYTGANKLYRKMGFSSQEKLQLYKNNKIENFTNNYLNKIWNKYYINNNTDALFASSFKTRLLNDYLVKIDRASMMNSVEVRSPFLDKDLVQFSLSLPNEIKLKKGITKYLLKKIAQETYDEKVFSRKKQGFGVPIKYWLNNELAEYVNYYLSKEVINKRGLFNSNYVNKIIKEHNVKLNNTHKIWALLVLEMWYQKFVD
jgi:asparagine synthase (glutamine-hydrolysing)